MSASQDGFYYEKEMNFIKNCLKKEMTYAEVADSIFINLGVTRTRNGIRKHVNRHREFYGKKPIIDKESYINSNKIKLNSVDNYLNVLDNISKKSKPIIKNISTINSKNESLVLVLSDLHIGKKIVDCKGVTTYNTEIALSYIKKLTSNILHIMEHAGKGTVIDEVVVLMVGDIVDNEVIYSSQTHHIDSCVSKQVQSATKALWELLLSFSNIKGIKSVKVVAVRGNHGVASRDASHEDSNWDNVVYNNLEYISSVTTNNITIETNYAEYNIAEVKGHKILIRHNIPLTADTAAAKAKLGGWFNIHNVDSIVGGHYHHAAIQTWNDKYIFRNGCLPGSDDLAERMAASSKPAQIIFGVSEKRLPTFMYIVSFDNIEI